VLGQPITARLSGRSLASSNRVPASLNTRRGIAERHPFRFRPLEGVKPGEPSLFPSLGARFGGGNIECSAMVRQDLGNQRIDIHLEVQT